MNRRKYAGKVVKLFNLKQDEWEYAISQKEIPYESPVSGSVKVEYTTRDISLASQMESLVILDHGNGLDIEIKCGDRPQKFSLDYWQVHVLEQTLKHISIANNYSKHRRVVVPEKTNAQSKVNESKL